MHERAVYTDMLPVISIENGLAFLTVTRDGHSVCTPVRHFEMFLAEANAKLALYKLERARQGKVIDLRPKRPK